MLGHCVRCARARLSGGTATAPRRLPRPPVRIIAGSSPAAELTDIVARLMASQWNRLLGQQFVVGTGPARRPPSLPILWRGLQGRLHVADRRHRQPEHRIDQPAAVSFDIVRDFTPVILIAGQPMILTCILSIGVSSVGELIALAKSKPGTLSYGSTGVGASPHLLTELFQVRTGTRMVHVPYQGGPRR